MKYISDSIEQTEEIAKEVVGGLNRDQNVVLLQGELGAGKTTFAQKILEHLGAKGPFTSPTFVIMKKYDLNAKLPLSPLLGRERETTPQSPPWKGGEAGRLNLKTVYHFDCYRVGSQDILDLGWEEIVSNKENLVLVEWPEKIKSIWPEKYVKIDFESLGEDKRKIVVS